MATTEVQPVPLATENDNTLLEKTEALKINDEQQDASSKASSFKDAPEGPTTEDKPAVPPAAVEGDLAPKGPIFKPLAHALPNCKPEPRPELTAEQEKKYNDLLAIVKSWKEIPATSAKGATADPINDTDRVWLTRDCLLRYQRATKWNTAEAAKRLLGTLTWQREYGLRSFITADHVSIENETGKQVLMGFDNDSRPCLYLNPGKQNTKFSDRQNQHLVFMLERVIDLMEPGQESNALLINYKDTQSKSNPPLSQGRAVLTILQTHYPERLGRALISDLPWYVTTFFKLISPFIDPVTKSKMKFNEPLSNHVPPEQLLSTYGGNVNFEYKHDVYWPALVELCENRRKDYILRWEKGGKHIGEIEAYLRGGDATSLDGKLKGSDLAAGFASA